MVEHNEYPSPRSQGPSGSASILVAQAYDTAPSETAKLAEQMSQEPNLPEEQPSSANFAEATPSPSRPRMSIRRAREPPKTPEGQIYCDHIECQSAPPFFKRPCEWKYVKKKKKKNFDVLVFYGRSLIS